jgi:hypothetical protein
VRLDFAQAFNHLFHALTNVDEREQPKNPPRQRSGEGGYTAVAEGTQLANSLKHSPLTRLPRGICINLRYHRQLAESPTILVPI